MRYRKKSVIVEAKQLNTQSFWEVYDWLGDAVRSWCWDHPDEVGAEREIIIETRAGKRTVWESDWVVKDVDGEFYLYCPDSFALAYEEAVEE